MKKISVAIATFNEEKNIGPCLKTVKDWVSEIVVVDGGSTDKTVALAKKYGAKVTVTDNPPIFHINKQKAVDQCSGDWILQLDADERVTTELKREIQEIIGMSPEEIKKRKLDHKKNLLFKRHQEILEQRDGKFGTEGGEIVAFFVPRRSYFLGRYLKYGGVYPDGVIRLFKKGKAYFPCKSVHEQIKVRGRVAWLENELLHFADPTFSHYLARFNRYSSLTAQEHVKKKQPLNMVAAIRYVIVIPLKHFLILFFRHKGFLDGFPGFVFAIFSAIQKTTGYVKYWELVHGKKIH